MRWWAFGEFLVWAEQTVEMLRELADDPPMPVSFREHAEALRVRLEELDHAAAVAWLIDHWDLAASTADSRARVDEALARAGAARAVGAARRGGNHAGMVPLRARERPGSRLQAARRTEPRRPRPVPPAADGRV